eukprot:TRINITY_DN27305_c0_g1_i2.p1 TRINITY_DN27305_c0_g1~~TRINITY_DN27305_c0_g1_i2.p1  ORF type:complete len:287 (+),score=8.52 TRINITY_DN27305_c0_g1_i2:51-911(+)
MQLCKAVQQSATARAKHTSVRRQDLVLNIFECQRFFVSLEVLSAAPLSRQLHGCCVALGGVATLLKEGTKYRCANVMPTAKFAKHRSLSQCICNVLPWPRNNLRQALASPLCVQTEIPPFQLVFMDRWGSEYMKDLALLENYGLVAPSALLLADNILRTVAPLFLERVAGSPEDAASRMYRSQIVRVDEFAHAADDWMTVSVRTGVTAVPQGTFKASAEMEQLQRDSERSRDRVFAPGRSVLLEERAAFSEFAEACFRRVGLAVTASAPHHRLESFEAVRPDVKSA